MKLFKRSLLLLCTAFLTLSMVLAIPFPEVRAAEPVVIVIDPGHGGTNEGANYSGKLEKNLDLIIANAMYEELSKYEGIKIYMTRTSDEELSLKQRADIAASVKADFLYSIHLNASNDHRLFGSEIWTSAYGNYYVEGQVFGRIASEQLGALGIFDRGIKTKLNGKRNGDYYGIISNCRAKGVKSVIIEHCHMDNSRDTEFISSDAKLKELGKADATAVAKYYGLKSSALGVDYSGYQKAQIKTPAGAVPQDETAPEICEARLVSYDGATKNAVINLKASDSNGKVIYYEYSLDGGRTFSELCKFAPAGDNGDIGIKMTGSEGTVVFRVVNQYRLTTTSNVVSVY